MANIKELKKGEKYQLSKSFNSTEFDCKCKDPDCKTTYIDLELVTFLENLRQKWGPIVLNCAYRCSKHNKEVGGATKSQHIEGTAADISPRHKNIEAAYGELDLAWKGGLGKYATFIHIDNRGSKARWDFSKTSHGKKA